MTTILILAADESIGDLLWRYVELAGYLPAMAHADEGSADAIGRLQPLALLLDASLGIDSLPAERAAAQGGVPIVYVASALSDGELRSHASEREAVCSPLSGGARKLASTLAELQCEDAARPASSRAADAHHSVLAAAAVVAHARRLSEAAEAVRASSRELRAERQIALAMCRERGDALRDAVNTFARELRGDGVEAERALTALRAVVLNALDATGASRDARATLDAAERCWREVFAA